MRQFINSFSVYASSLFTDTTLRHHFPLKMNALRIFNGVLFLVFNFIYIFVCVFILPQNRVLLLAMNLIKALLLPMIIVGPRFRAAGRTPLLVLMLSGIGNRVCVILITVQMILI